MIKKNLLKGICLLWLLLAVTPVLQAQDRAQQASELLDRLIAGQGDSVYVHLDDNIRKMLSVEIHSVSVQPFQTGVAFPDSMANRQ